MGLKVVEYLTSNGTSPYAEFLLSLDLPIRARIQARIFRFETGNLGDVRSLGSGIFEARFMFGPGYRVYFAVRQGKLILLLGARDKSSQRKDINLAKERLLDYLGRFKNE